MTIVIKDELSKLLKEHGRQAFLRQKGDQRCSCWDPLTLEADRECDSCSGFGYVYTDKKIRIRKSVDTTPTSGAYRRPPAAFGHIFVDEATIYFEQVTQTDVNVSTHDWIIECKTKADGTLWAPYLIERIWDVNEVIDYREDKGQFSYYAVRCRRLALGK